MENKTIVQHINEKDFISAKADISEALMRKIHEQIEEKKLRVAEIMSEEFNSDKSETEVVSEEVTE